tara:strand:- start:3334 stop:3543 length:210 start_codon:yes stop_codon:yes gene_type:complete
MKSKIKFNKEFPFFVVYKEPQLFLTRKKEWSDKFSKARLFNNRQAAENFIEDLDFDKKNPFEICRVISD